jgi:uncharacterized membrane protein YgdD (TMEM256/DUF423 family)
MRLFYYLVTVFYYMPKIFLIFASINGALAVMLGAFGAHGLKGKVSESLLAAYKTGVDYHLLHVLALMALALLMLRAVSVPVWFIITGYCWMAGILLFSGSLYGLALGGPYWLGPVTPVGGLLLIVGWLCLTVGLTQSSFTHSSL